MYAIVAFFLNTKQSAHYVNYVFFNLATELYI